MSTPSPLPPLGPEFAPAPPEVEPRSPGFIHRIGSAALSGLTEVRFAVAETARTVVEVVANSKDRVFNGVNEARRSSIARKLPEAHTALRNASEDTLYDRESGEANIRKTDPKGPYNPLWNEGGQNNRRGGYGETEPVPDAGRGARTSGQEHRTLMANRWVDHKLKAERTIHKFVGLHGPMLYDEQAVEDHIASNRLTRSQANALRRAGEIVRDAHDTVHKYEHKLEAKADGNDRAGRRNVSRIRRSERRIERLDEKRTKLTRKYQTRGWKIGDRVETRRERREDHRGTRRTRRTTT